MSGSSRQRPSPSKRQRGGALSFDNNEEVSPCDPSIGHGRVGMSSMPSGRRRRTALGMVSDRPFRGPQAEALEHMDFTTLGLLDDLVDSMAEFGQYVRLLWCCTLSLSSGWHIFGVVRR